MSWSRPTTTRSSVDIYYCRTDRCLVCCMPCVWLNWSESHSSVDWLPCFTTRRRRNWCHTTSLPHRRWYFGFSSLSVIPTCGRRSVVDKNLFRRAVRAAASDDVNGTTVSACEQNPRHGGFRTLAVCVCVCGLKWSHASETNAVDTALNKRWNPSGLLRTPSSEPDTVHIRSTFSLAWLRRSTVNCCNWWRCSELNWRAYVFTSMKSHRLMTDWFIPWFHCRLRTFLFSISPFIAI